MPKYRKDIDRLMARALEAGWRCEQSPGKHPVLYPNDRDASPIPVPISLSDHRGLMNFRSQLRRSGLKI